MIRQRHPPRRFNKIIEVVLSLSKLGRLRFQTCELAINAIENSNNEGEQHSSPKIPAGIKQRHAQTENCGSKRDLIRSDRRSTEMRNQPLLNRCVHKRRKIKDTFLCRVTQQIVRPADGARAKELERRPAAHSCACFQRMLAVGQRRRALCDPPSYPK